MKNYENTSHKINNLWNQESQIKNNVDKVNYIVEKISLENSILTYNLYESDWLLCSQTIYEDDNVFAFNFTFNYEITINEDNLDNIDYAVILKGNNIINYKTLLNGAVLTNSNRGVSNAIFNKIEENRYVMVVTGIGVAEGTDAVYVKLLITFKNKEIIKTIKKHEII